MTSHDANIDNAASSERPQTVLRHISDGSRKSSPSIGPALLSCVPGTAALAIYIISRATDMVPAILGYAFWPLSFVGVFLGVRFVWLYRRRRGDGRRPRYVDVAMAVHVVVLLPGLPFILLIAADLTLKLLQKLR